MRPRSRPSPSRGRQPSSPGANDALADIVAKRPDPFQGFAALAMQDVDGAIEELRRAIRQLGFRGALVNGFSQVNDPNSAIYLDLPQYRPFWAEVQKLDYPFYLHPRNPLPAIPKSTRAIPGFLARLGIRPGDGGARPAPHRLGPLRRVSAHPDRARPPRPALQHVAHRPSQRLGQGAAQAQGEKKIVEYFNANFHLTTSGNFRTQTLIDAMLEIGADRILFSTDWPFENIDHAADWFDACSISEADRIKIGRANARRLFKLD